MATGFVVGEGGAAALVVVGRVVSSVTADGSACAGFESDDWTPQLAIATATTSIKAVLKRKRLHALAIPFSFCAR